MAEPGKQRDLVLSHIGYVWVQDLSGGGVYAYCGPHKEALAAESVLVTQDGDDGAFERVPYEREQEGYRTFTIAREGQYVVLHNPAVKADADMSKGENAAIPLQVGKSVIKCGPCQFPLWPGQRAEVIDGHRMNEDQFLRIRVTGDVSPEDAAALQGFVREEWRASKQGEAELPKMDETVFAVGSEFIIRGDRTSFFIPPTGVTVLPAEEGVTRGEDQYVMEGVKPGADEYVKLINRVGRISYVRGPATVIPCVDQELLTEACNSAVFDAVSIDENSGVLLRTLVELTKSQIQDRMGNVAIQFPSSSKPSQQAASPTPAPVEPPPSAQAEDESPEEAESSTESSGETSESRETVESTPLAPTPETAKEDGGDEDEIFPPGTELVIWKERRLVFPADGIELIRRFEAVHILPGTARYVKHLVTGRTRVVAGECLYLADPRFEEYATRPIDASTLDVWFPGGACQTNKPELVPCITVQQGTAAMILKPGSGGSREVRRIITGYATYFLAWDETLCEMKLAASGVGKAKDYKSAIRICYLWLRGNRISDTLPGRTREDCAFETQYVLTVDFDPDHQDAWFNVDDYVYLVCEEVRSRLRGGLLAQPIHELAVNYVEVIREIALGRKPENGHRPGIEFPRFGARLVDIHVLEFRILDEDLQEQLSGLQQTGIRESVQTRTEGLKLEGERARAEIEREALELQLSLAKLRAEQEANKAQTEEEKRRRASKAAQETKLAQVTEAEEFALRTAQRDADTVHFQCV